MKQVPSHRENGPIGMDYHLNRKNTANRNQREIVCYLQIIAAIKCLSFSSPLFGLDSSG